MNFPYEWTLKDAKFTKDKGTVFSCFSCGGGSTMGYKLAGFDVIGCNEIDPKMMACYIENHHAKYSYLEDIRTFKLRTDLPEELYQLDILDGSPPCSSFSMAGNREDDWGKQKQFREGQQEQVLDTLFFDFIDVAKMLQPKIVIAENVKGLLMGEAISYVEKINQSFDDAGYSVQVFLLDASRMGVPQRRERVFFVALRKDLISVLECSDLYGKVPAIDLQFNEEQITYKKIRDQHGNSDAYRIGEKVGEYWEKTPPWKAFSYNHPNGSYFNEVKSHPDKVLPTIRASGLPYDYSEKRTIFHSELTKSATFPTDYNFLKQKPGYVCGMSVPPVMVAQIATRIYNQWLCKINKETTC